MTIGRPIATGQVLSKSGGIIAEKPVLLLPQVITLIPSLLATLILGISPVLSLLALIIGVVSGVVAVIVSGAYPFLVKAVVDRGRFSISDAMGKAFHKFWTLVGAGILVGLIVALGTIALIVPGLILMTWYAYTVPAIMLEDKGVLGGMAASKAFGHDKKWSTLALGLAVVLVVVVALSLGLGITVGGSALLGRAVDEILFVPISAWSSVIFAYTYISYGPTSVTATVGAPAPEMMPSVQAEQPGVQAGASVTRFCPACGSPVEPGSRFCRYCGKAL